MQFPRPPQHIYVHRPSSTGRRRRHSDLIGQARRGSGAGAGMVIRLAEGSGSGVATCGSPGLRGPSGSGAMLRLAAKLMAFFWRRADGPKERTGLQELELLEGASRGGAGARWGPGGRAGPGVLMAPPGTGNCTVALRDPPRVRAAFRAVGLGSPQERQRKAVCARTC